MEKKKPKWGKPKLIVLVRGKLEEMVLLNCKMPGTGYAAQPSSMIVMCNVISGCSYPCDSFTPS